MVLMFAALATLDHFTNIAILGAVGATSVAASCFIAFTRPHAIIAQPTHMVGSYVLGMVVGVLCYHCLHFLLHDTLEIWGPYAHEFCGALAVGLMFVAMLQLHLEHPPAAGLALGLVFERWDGTTLVIIIGSVIVIALVKQWLLPRLRDLY